MILNTFRIIFAVLVTIFMHIILKCYAENILQIKYFKYFIIYSQIGSCSLYIIQKHRSKINQNIYVTYLLTYFFISGEFILFIIGDNQFIIVHIIQ